MNEPSLLHIYLYTEIWAISTESYKDRGLQQGRIFGTKWY